MEAEPALAEEAVKHHSRDAPRPPRPPRRNGRAPIRPRRRRRRSGRGGQAARPSPFSSRRAERARADDALDRHRGGATTASRGHEIEVPPSYAGISALSTGCNGERAALREPSGLEAEPEAPEIVGCTLFHRTATPEAHRVREPRGIHAVAVISNSDPGVPAGPLKVDPDVARASCNRVVDQIRDRGRQPIAERPHALDECRGVWRNILHPLTGDPSSVRLPHLLPPLIRYPCRSAQPLCS